MARNEYVFLQGKVKWCMTKQLNQFGKWVCTIYPNEESKAKIDQLIKDGIKNELKKDDDGYFIAFSRPPEKIDRSGRRFPLTPVEVVDKDGKAFDGRIGNGSDCTIKLEVYGGKRPGGLAGTYKAARLAGIRVDNLVPYDPSESNNRFTVRQVEGLKEQPEQQNIGW